MAAPQEPGAPVAETVNVVSPLGSIGSVSAAQLAEAERQGYRVASPEEVAHAKNEAKYGGVGGAALAGAAGVARGATLGLSDAAGRAIGIEDDLRGLREANPITSGVGEVGGSLLGMGKLGGPSLFMRGARALSAPARAATRAGMAAERALGGGVLGTVAQGAVEGGLFGAGAGLSQVALADEEMTGDRLAVALGAGALHGALFGGGVGAGIGIAGKAARGAGGLIERAITRPTIEGLEGVAAREFGSAAPGIGRKMMRWFVREGGDHAGASLATAEGRRIAINAEQEIARHLDDMTGALTKAHETGEAVAQQFSGGFKRSQIASLMRRGNESQTITAGFGVMSKLRQQIDDAITAGVDVNFYGKLKSQLDDMEIRLNAAQRLGLGSKTLNEDLFMDLDVLKRRVGQRAMKYAKRGPHGLGPDQHQSWQALRSMYDDTLRPVLESQQLWGKAGAAQSAINGPWKKLLDTRFGAGTTRGFESMFATKSTTWDGSKWLIDRKKVAAFLDSVTDPAEHEGLQVLEDWLTRQQEFVDVAKKHLSLGPAEAKAADELSSTVASLRTTRDKVVEAAQLRNQLQKLDEADGRGNLFASAAGYAIGAGMLGPAGGVGLALLGTLTSRGATIRKLAAAEQLLAGYGAQVTRGVHGIFRGATSIATKTALPSSAVGDQMTERRKRFEARESQLRAVAMNPEAARKRAAGMFAPIKAEFPKATAAAVDRLLASADYLHKHLPVRPTDRYPLLPPRAISRSELDSWERRVEAVDDPIGALTKGLQMGRLAPETVEAVKATAPRVWEDVTEGMLSEMATLQAEGRTLPYRARLAIGAIAGPAADPTLEPAVIGYLQAMHNADPVMDEPVQSPAEAPQLAAGYETEAQRLAAER